MNNSAFIIQIYEIGVILWGWIRGGRVIHSNTAFVYEQMKGIFRFLLATTFIYPFLQCSKMPSPTEGLQEGTAAGGEKTMLALGDSYTIGQSVQEALRFPDQAVSMLNRLGIQIKAPDYVARTGWTTVDLSAALQQSNIQSTYDYVTLLIGVNDQYRGMDIDTYNQHFRELLNRSLEYADGKRKHVIVISIPDYSITPFVPQSEKATVSREIAAYNQINMEVTNSAGCIYLDITDIYRKSANDPSLIAADNLHPSEKEYTKWAELIVQYISSVKS